MQAAGNKVPHVHLGKVRLSDDMNIPQRNMLRLVS